MADDQSWAAVSRAIRDALALLGHPITAKCLPDEAEPCGASFSQHAAAHLGCLLAIADHQLDHLGPAGWVIATEVKDHKLAELRGCQPD
jgi:hypothetical protein